MTRLSLVRAMLTLLATVPVGVVGVLGSETLSGGGAPRQAVTPPVTAAITPPRLGDTIPRDLPGLHNVVAYHSGFYSGGVPEAERGFITLSRLDVRTIISVDGAVPDVAAAEMRGIRYVHLPIRYDGITEERKLQLARATRDAMADGPVYVHCHHGKHRSAGAAATIAVSLGWATPDEMIARMRVSGTSAVYAGLYSCTANAAPISRAALDAVPADFPSIARPAGLVKGMVEMERRIERLEMIEIADWSVPPDHPDLVPAAEAGRLADVLRLLEGDQRVQTAPADFTDLLRATRDEAQRLEDMLVAGGTGPAQLSRRLRAVVASCSECHIRHRD